MIRLATALVLAATVSTALAGEPAGVLNGIDVLARDQFASLRGRRVGLITNHTGISLDGRSTIDLLHAAPEVKLVALFSPEHGIRGLLDEKVSDSVDEKTGLKVHSLYGKTQRPTAEMLEGVDTLVFDIQDIGTRFYTYVATMGFAMEEAAARKLRFVVLDRPNPITGVRVFGPFNDKDGQFTAYHRMPLVHGMTVGELATMFDAERKIGCELVVVKMEGWKREMWFDETGQTWVNPSPNMRSLTQATLYPGIGMLEACNLSVGRGTDTPFERLGAPWVDERRLAAALNAKQLAGVRFVPLRFTPNASKFKDKSCGGVQVLLVDRDKFDPSECGLTIAAELERLHGEKFDAENVNRLIINSAVTAKIGAAEGMARWTPTWADELKAFEAVRRKHLLY